MHMYIQRIYWIENYYFSDTNSNDYWFIYIQFAHKLIEKGSENKNKRQYLPKRRKKPFSITFLDK
jgi:hypothetical protein